MAGAACFDWRGMTQDAMAGEFPLDRSGVWREVRRPRSGASVPALFLDRDGTLIELVPYLADPAKVRLIEPAVALVKAANRRGLPVVVITNQSGIARGLYGWPEFATVEARIAALLAEHGAALDAVIACPAAPDSDAPCRKPNPGMITLGAELLALDLGRSRIAGDSAIDIEAGWRAGLSGGWLAPTGYGPRDAEAARALAAPDYEVTALHPLDKLAHVIGSGG